MHDAALADWRFVEPAIFGTLLERALDPRERHKLGAHYTPRAYVERLVFPTVIEPLRYEWENAKATALAYDGQNNRKEAVNVLRGFQRKLAETRVLDPACGSGNFLYVTMEHMKRLEGEIIGLLHDLGESQTLMEMQGLTVDPHQFLGIEINTRAAKIAELVIWIGYLQWHFRTHGSVAPPQPVLRNFKNIENRDALIDYDRKELLCDEAGKPITRWDGVTMKKSPITGELIPDETAQMEQYVYVNPRKARWPEAEYIVGNPPFVGNKRMRMVLGDSYVATVRRAWTSVPESADFVMYWWDIAASALVNGITRRFGFITTNSVRQSFNRRVIESHLVNANPPSLVFAIPDHPWVDATDGAAVRISMTVLDRESSLRGHLLAVFHEERKENGNTRIQYTEQTGVIHANLTIGANPANAVTLKSNRTISQRGMIPHGKGFLVTDHEGANLDSGALVRPYLNGRDLMASTRSLNVVDTFGLSEHELREKYPSTYQWLHARVKPQRDLVKRASTRKNWWIFGEQRKILRDVLRGLTFYIMIAQTSKHSVFVKTPTSIVPDDKLIAIGVESEHLLGTLSSRVHVTWALVTGGSLGVGNDPVYNKTKCFEAFPFPILTSEQCARIGGLAEKIDAHRKRQQAQHEKLTLTNIYNVLEKLRSGEELTAKERVTHEQGLVSILRELHDELDRAVFEAYGWDDLAEVLVGRPGATTPLLDKPEDQAEAEEELLRRLVELNAERAEEEKNGLIRWLRPEYQNPSGAGVQADSQEEMLEDDEVVVAAPTAKLPPWPKTVPEQIVAVRSVMLASGLRNPSDVVAQFSGRATAKKGAEVKAAVDSLVALGVV